jgi:hypothetical protein
MRFWIDVAVAIVTLLIIQALVLAALGRLWTRRTAPDTRT